MINIEDLRAIKELSDYIFNEENGWRAIQLNSNVAELIDADDVKDTEKSCKTSTWKSSIREMFLRGWAK